MLQEVIQDYAAYLKLDVSNGFHMVQDVIDNMLTRLEELSSVLQMIRVKNSDCNSTVTQDIKKYRNEINLLSKKIETLISVVSRLSLNVELLENQVEKAEHDFGVNNDSKLKNLFKPFLKKKEPMLTKNALVVPDKLKLETVLDNFENLDS
ncbi:unnamed protein product [Chilo suppressalis]|uniref:Uncharacterized protein n=1 Tax=Chilo suppressalis TaxID=168631 RepID=A0ABN8B0L9_CHISP|nr:hypothetical protein evm_001917 [Chilo suppressalis]CAH0402362.1 unnamed protein product [Chilo suppressalis]